MFSSALKSISATNITSNYSVSPNPTSTAGPWRIYDAKKKSTGKPYSVFVFEKKAFDAHGNSLGRSSATSFKRSVEEAVDRLKREASNLAKLRHPNILELVEPVEETRGGGLQFVTEPVTASLASLLQEKDEQERSVGPGGRPSRFVTEDSDGVRRRRELEIDELEIQKGLLQISKALEFLHENAGLVHGNLTPHAVLVNAKSDWKISGLSFCSPPDNSTKPTSVQGISLHEVLNMDPRLPKSVQLNLDYTSPDFVMDNNLTSSADMFSLGLLSIALYNSPHESPLQSHGSVTSYKRLFSSSSTVPSSSNNFLSSRPLPKDLTTHVLPRLITRRPAQRMTALEFQHSEFFDNILVSTIRFLDAFPAKTSNEKSQFLRGLNKVLPSFPKSVMEKKILPALLDELKDKELLSLILQNVFKIIGLLPSARRSFGEKVCPALRDIFVVNAKQMHDKDSARDAGLMVFLENLSAATNNCSGREFKDDMLPIIIGAIECSTPSIVDAALRNLSVILPVLDFSTVKNELFPAISNVFSKTTSLAIKVRGLQAFVVLCGGSTGTAGDGLDGLPAENRKSSSGALDKYTMQEKIVPLIRGIKTKEPAVMMAALNVLRMVGQAADSEFVAMDILPILWSMSLGPLLDLKQFQAFMGLIKTLSRRVEDDQTRKLQELSNTNGSSVAANEDFLSFGGISGTTFDQPNGASEDDDFEALVKGHSHTHKASSNAMPSWDEPKTAASSKQARPLSTSTKSQAPAFSWSTPSPSSAMNASGTAGRDGFRTITPDLASFGTLTPTSTQFSQPMEPTASTFPAPQDQPQHQSGSSVRWAAASPGATTNSWASGPSSPNHTSTNPSHGHAGVGVIASSMSNMSLGGQRPSMGSSRGSSFSLAPPPSANANAGSPTSFGISPASTGGSLNQSGWNTGVSGSSSVWHSASQPSPLNNAMRSQAGMSVALGGQQQQQQQQQQKSGLDKYQSLI